MSRKVSNLEDADTMKDYFDFFACINEQRLDSGYPMGGVTYSSDKFLNPSLPHEYQLAHRIREENVPKFKDSDILEKPVGYYLTEFRSGEQDYIEVLTDEMKKYLSENDLEISGPLLYLVMAAPLYS